MYMMSIISIYAKEREGERERAHISNNTALCLVKVNLNLTFLQET